MKSKIYTIETSKPAYSVHGNAKKGLAIAIHHTDAQENKATLEGLLKAIKYDIDEDILLLTIEQKPIDINNILHDQSIRDIILIGISPEEVSFALHARHNFLHYLEGRSLICTHSLSEMNADKSKKMNFWQVLQQRFL